MSSGLAFDYAVWVFFGALGVVQIAAAQSGLTGLLFLRRWRRATVVLGALLIAAATAWFFGSAQRNLPDTGGGLDANSQALWFACASAAAVAVTYALSSVVNHRWAVLSDQEEGREESRDGDRPQYGLERLRHTTFVRAIAGGAASLRRSRR